MGDVLRHGLALLAEPCTIPRKVRHESLVSQVDALVNQHRPWRSSGLFKQIGAFCSPCGCPRETQRKLLSSKETGLGSKAVSALGERHTETSVSHAFSLWSFLFITSEMLSIALSHTLTWCCCDPSYD